jgi:hypothetical protein
VSESREGFSVHVTIDVMGVGSKAEAQEAAMAQLADLPDNMKVSNVHIGRYVITALSDKYKDSL